NFYAAFEQAVTAYGNEVYAYKLRENYLSIEGASTGSSLNNALITPNFSTIIRISETYGSEAGVGGEITYHTGSITLRNNVQQYDLKLWASASGIEAGDLEIKRIFYEGSPAIVRYFDPYAGVGSDFQGLLESFEWGQYSPGINFVMMPIYFDLEKIQAIEFNDQIRRSAYTFEIRNNVLKIFPIPSLATPLFFEYILKSDRYKSSISQNTGKVTNVLNAPYGNPDYCSINSIGRQWIFEYTICLAKEMLGYVRGKYQAIPIPNSTTTLNSSDLISAASSEKTALIEKLKMYLDETSRKTLLENRASEAESQRLILNQIPSLIFIG
ncbi:hypothetical protein EBU94_09110, partial [bacterium]|nr:hypothetical protein [bacterium]